MGLDDGLRGFNRGRRGGGCMTRRKRRTRGLDERLGGATAERTALIQRIEAQERIKEQFEQVASIHSMPSSAPAPGRAVAAP